MARRIWLTAVGLLALLVTIAACNPANDGAAGPEIKGPAFLLFYTDN